jgi:Protein of unknown function (DUF1236)
MKSQFLTSVCTAALAAMLGVGVAYAEPTDHQAASVGAPQAGDGNGPSGNSAAPGGGAMTERGDGRDAATHRGAADDKIGDNPPATSLKPGGKAANAKDRNGNKSAEGDKSGDYGDRDRAHREAPDRDQIRDEKSAERYDRDTDETSRHDRDNKTAESKDRNDHKNGKRAEFDSQDKQKVKRYFTEHKPRAKRIDRDRVNVSIGVAIPGSIALYPLPAGIIVAAGGCPVQYFLWGDDLVVVDSCSREVVDIVPGIG